MNFKTTKELKISKSIVGQVIGQEEAINIIKKAAKQRRNVLLIGEPGTGKSMIGQALAELLPKEKLHDVLASHNPSDDNVPLIASVARGQGKKLITAARLQSVGSFRNQNVILFIFVLVITLLPYYFYSRKIFPFDSPIIYAASMITSMIFVIGFVIFMNLSKKMNMSKSSQQVPKILIDNSNKMKAPFIDATGAHAGALLGDVLHDPLQSFYPYSSVIIMGGSNRGIEMKELLDPIFEENKDKIIKKEDYEALHLPKDKLKVLGLKGGLQVPVEVLSMNRHPNKSGKLIKITTESGKEILVTSEHKIAVENSASIIFKRADKISDKDKLIGFENGK